MANKTVRLRLIELSGASGLTLELYAQGSESIANGSGDSLTPGAKGLFTAVVTEAITGWFDVAVYNGSSLVASRDKLLIEADVEGTYDVDNPAALSGAIVLTGAAVIGFSTVDGSTPNLVIGDDYLIEHSRAIDILIDPVPGVSAETFTCTFGGEAQHRGSWLVTGVATAVTVDGNPKWRLRFELDGADTIDCKPGCYAWSATVLSAAGKRITRITGEVALVASQTIE